MLRQEKIDKGFSFNKIDPCLESTVVRVLMKKNNIETYLCENNERRGQKVLKLIDTSQLCEKNIKKYLSEIKNFGSNHSNLMDMRAIYLEGKKLLVISSTYKKGGTLNEISNVLDYFDENNRFKFLLEICNGVEHIHKQGLCHTNIKPSNIIISNHNHYILTDTFLNILLFKENNINMNFNNFEYSSPELLKGSEYTTSCDMWSIGCIFYYIYNGHNPFQNDMNKSRIEIFLAINQCKFDYGLIEYHDELFGICNRLLCADPSERFTIQELKFKIENINTMSFIPPLLSATNSGNSTLVLPCETNSPNDEKYEKIDNKIIYCLNHEIDELNMCNQLIGDIGMQYLCENVKYIKTLKKLNLENNRLTNYSVEMMLYHLDDMKLVEEICLLKNNITIEGYEQLFKSLNDNFKHNVDVYCDKSLFNEKYVKLYSDLYRNVVIHF